MTDEMAGNPTEGTEDGTPKVEADIPEASETGDEDTQKWSQVEIDGKTFQSPDELKEHVKVLNKRLKDGQSYISKQGEEIRAMGEQVAELRGAVGQINAAQESEVDDEAEFLANPTEYVKKVKAAAIEEATKLVEGKSKEFMTTINAEKTEERQWDTFMKDHKQLKVLGKDFLKVLAGTIAPSVAHLPRSQALDVLAERANEYVLRIPVNADDKPAPGIRPARTPEKGIPKAMSKKEYAESQIAALNETKGRIKPSHSNLPRK
ncbi:MAG: hypothetical protein GY861_08335 [bacterium]|nr:hypothetical protein [bacterium]